MAEFAQPCNRFIQDKLTADSSLVALVGGRIYDDEVVPQGAVHPFVSYGPLSLLNRNALPAYVTMFAMPIYIVRVTDKGRDKTTAFSVIRRINAVLIGQSGTVSVAGETYYFGPWFWKDTRSLPVAPEGTLNFISMGVEMESRVQRIA